MNKFVFLMVSSVMIGLVVNCYAMKENDFLNISSQDGKSSHINFNDFMDSMFRYIDIYAYGNYLIPFDAVTYKLLIAPHRNAIFLWVENNKKQVVAYALAELAKDNIYSFKILHVMVHNARKYGIGDNLKNMMGYVVHDQGGRFIVGLPSSFNLRPTEDQGQMQEKLVKFYQRGVKAENIGSELGVNLNDILGPNPQEPQYTSEVVYILREEHIEVKPTHAVTGQAIDQQTRARL